MDSARARKSKYWNVELQLPDGPYYQKNDKPVYGPSLYYFDEKGWEQRTKIQKKPL